MPVRGEWSWIGSSVRGPRHRVEGTANQDAWRVCCRSRFFAAVVCDGLGSRAHSGFGARAACRAVVAAAEGEYVQGSLRERVRAHLVDARAAVESGAAGDLLRRWADTSQALRERSSSTSD